MAGSTNSIFYHALYRAVLYLSTTPPPFPTIVCLLPVPNPTCHPFLLLLGAALPPSHLVRSCCSARACCQRSVGSHPCTCLPLAHAHLIPPPRPNRFGCPLCCMPSWFTLACWRLYAGSARTVFVCAMRTRAQRARALRFTMLYAAYLPRRALVLQQQPAFRVRSYIPILDNMRLYSLLPAEGRRKVSTARCFGC